jgi:hypothetical protein
MKDSILKKDFYKITDDFLASCIECGLGMDELYRFYIGKNILNGFRQDHGYKDGVYKKVWDGKEDNVVMSEILDDHTDITADLLYAKLSEAYSKLS